MKQTFLQYLKEARKNPDLNTKTSVNDQIIQAADQFKSSPLSSGDTNGFVSFTSLNKLGINPSSTHNTPLGIYAYPIDYVINRIGHEQHPKDVLPFAGDEEYANTFQVTGNIINLQKMTSNDVRQYLTKLVGVMHHYLPELTPDQISDIIAGHTRESQDQATVKTPAGRFWYITMMLASEPKGTTPRLWNHIFRRLGIDGFIDNGDQIIHHNEPYQAVFFSLKSIKNINRFSNKWSPKQSSEKADVGRKRHRDLSVIGSSDTSLDDERIELALQNPEYLKYMPSRMLDRAIAAVFHNLNGRFSPSWITSDKLLQILNDNPELIYKTKQLEIPDDLLIKWITADPNRFFMLRDPSERVHQAYRQLRYNK
jgi:hypothetical protein